MLEIIKNGTPGKTATALVAIASCAEYTTYEHGSWFIKIEVEGLNTQIPYLGMRIRNDIFKLDLVWIPTNGNDYMFETTEVYRNEE